MQRRRALAAVVALVAGVPSWRAEAQSGAAPVAPREFGASGDGETDDTRALQRALDHARDIGGELHLTPDVYAISEYLIVRHGVRALVGRGGEIRCIPGRQNAGLLLASIALGERENVRGLRIDSLVIDAAHRTLPVNAIHAQNCRDCRITGNRIINLRAGSGVLIHSLAEGRQAAVDNLIADNTTEGEPGVAGTAWWGIRINAPPRFAEGIVSQDQQWKARFAAADAVLPIVRQVVRGNLVRGGYYGVWLMAARDCLVQDNQLHDQVRSISLQDCSQGNHISGNRCTESLSSATHLDYGTRDNVLRGNHVQTERGEGEGLLQAYVGVSNNQFINNEVLSHGSSRYFVYCGVHADGNEFRCNILRGRAVRACVALESAWNGWSLHPAHYDHLKGPGVNGFARHGRAGNRLIGNTIEGERDAPALFLAQIGDSRTPLRDSVIEANRVLGDPGRRQLELLETMAGQLRGLCLVGNRFAAGAQARQFVLPRGLKHCAEARDNGIFDRLVGQRH